MIDGMVMVSDISRLLQVKETTVKKWFACKMDYYHDSAFVDLGEFFGFLAEYRKGYYATKLVERYKINEDDEGVRQLLQIILRYCRIFIDIRVFGECEEEILKVIKPKGIEARVVFM